ncbi:hypothetical protein [Curtobacterium sp. BRB10]|uniref:hypothetical protein n=1 Tax=Curtobacterium sp. BRB10 TaxID=2962579 RepID=UPI00288178E1|nr:hypothetical protein [Curtobacterium sp. BRB10]MDT0232015.1 hypothetical protein [Curtobacterium sp. BRB10]
MREYSEGRHGHRAYRRAQSTLKRRTAADNLPCWWCCNAIDTTLPDLDRMAFTPDHPDALANGERLASQQRQPMHRHRHRDASKGDSADVEI